MYHKKLSQVKRTSRFPFKILLTIFLFAGLGISLAFNVVFFQKINGENIVVRVVDGDTFQLKSGKRVRLMGVDAPEYDRCGGRQAKARLTELISGENVTLQEEVTESYGRSLALVYVDNQFINKIILEEGWGRTDYRKNSQREVLTSAYHEAQVNKLGIFSDLCREEMGSENPKGDCVIKGNIDLSTYDKFYHLPGCPHYDEIVLDKDRGEGYFCSEEEAAKEGFRKASGCP